EEKIKFEHKDIFYNPEMRFCRSIYSLAIGAIEEKISVLDGFCASGIRGVRYAKENKNVSGITFLDWSANGIKLSKANVKKNNVKNAKYAKEDATLFLVNNFYEAKYDFDFIELDPFGTPAPYLYPAFFSMQKKKMFYLSATATDTAVLCGPEAKACLKNYHSRSMNNEFTHENGLRILIKRIAEVGAEFNFGIEPLFSISDRHYMKVLVKCTSNAVLADESMKKLGFVSNCSCGWRSAGKRIKEKCERCGKEPDYGGPLWLGETSDKKFVEKMIALNKERNYANFDEIAKKLEMVRNEHGMPPWYFDIHRICKRIGTGGVPKTEKVIAELQKKGFMACRTHFSDFSIKSNAGIDDVEKAIRKGMK
ncbi:MAG: tRNA (guanine(10)-N(2))-dimethyltransferase, partial [Candidatus Micrarchaeia archaeon]